MLFVIFSFVIMCQISAAQDRIQAEKMIQATLDTVLSVLGNEKQSVDEKSAKIIEIVSPMFDFHQMAKLTLGRKYWPQLSEKEQKRFTKLFIKRLQMTYKKKLMLYTDQKIIYEPSILLKNKIRVPTFVVSDNSDDDISIVYKLYFAKRGWKIYDIEIQGVSLIQSYRCQFDYILKNGTVSDLLAKLEGPETEDH